MCSDVTLIQGDCLEVLRGLPNDRAALVFTSPPYNMNLRIRNGKYCRRQIVKEISTKYENFDDARPMDEYFEFNRDVISECLRVADLVVFNVQFLTGNKPALFRLMGEFHSVAKEFIVWDKVNAQPAIGEGVMNSQFEVLLVFQRSAPKSRAFNTAQFDRGTLSNVWRIPRGAKFHPSHGASFPLALSDQVIRSFTRAGDTVLDPFMGVGSCGVSSKNGGRNFIGIEIDPEYFKLARDRIHGAGIQF